MLFQQISAKDFLKNINEKLKEGFCNIEISTWYHFSFYSYTYFQFTLVRTSSVEQLQQQSSDVIHSSQTGGHHYQHQQIEPIKGAMPGNPLLSCHLSRSTISPDQRLVGTSHQMTGTPSRSIQQQQQTQAEIQHAGTGTATCYTVKQQNCQNQFLVCNNVARYSSKVTPIYDQ